VPKSLDHIIWYYAFDKGPVEMYEMEKLPICPPVMQKDRRRNGQNDRSVHIQMRYDGSLL